MSEMKVRLMIDAGRLRCLGAWETTDGRQRRHISPESVRELFPDDGSYQLRRLAMGAILGGRLTVPVPAGRWGPPAPLSSVVDVLISTSGRGSLSLTATADRTSRSSTASQGPQGDT